MEGTYWLRKPRYEFIPSQTNMLVFPGLFIYSLTQYKLVGSIDKRINIAACSWLSNTSDYIVSTTIIICSCHMSVVQSGDRKPASGAHKH